MTEIIRALLLQKDGKRYRSEVRELSTTDIPEHAYPEGSSVKLAVRYSALNYKDAMILCGNQGSLVKKFPHVPGVDSIGEVVESNDKSLKAGTPVIRTGYNYGERFWGGYATQGMAKAEHLVPVPKGLTLESAASLGTAGLTAMLSILALEHAGVSPTKKQPIVVSGANGGVGSWSVRLLSALGYEVIAITRNPSQKEKRLFDAGAHDVIDIDVFTSHARDLLAKAKYQGAIDTLGGDALASIVSQLSYGGAVACCGLVLSPHYQSTLYPLLLRGISILGIDSVMANQSQRQEAWRILTELHTTYSHIGEESWCEIITLDEVEMKAQAMLRGETKGRIIVRL